jgi:hypothetical protein
MRGPAIFFPDSSRAAEQASRLLTTQCHGQMYWLPSQNVQAVFWSDQKCRRELPCREAGLGDLANSHQSRSEAPARPRDVCSAFNLFATEPRPLALLSKPLNELKWQVKSPSLTGFCTGTASYSLRHCAATAQQPNLASAPPTLQIALAHC